MGYFHLTYSGICTKWSKVGISDKQKWTWRFWNQTRLSYFFFSSCVVYILRQGQKAVLTIVVFQFVDILYSKFKLYEHFLFAELKIGYFAVTCKWMTCTSGYKKFWKQAVCIQKELLYRPLTIMILFLPYYLNATYCISDSVL